MTRRCLIAVLALLSGALIAVLSTGTLGARTATAAEPATTTQTGWTTPTQIDPALGTSGFSCASSTLCLAVGQAGADVYDGTSWEGIESADTSPLTAVSCAPSTTFCVAGAENGDLIPFQDGVAEAPVTVANVDGDHITDIACPTANFCMASSSGGVYELDGTTWSPASEPDFDGPLVALTCATANFCMAADQTEVSSWTDGEWSAPTSLFTAAGDVFSALACVPGGTSCVATDFDDNAYAFSAGDWSGPQHLGTSGSADAAACAPDGSCTVIIGSIPYSNAPSQAYTYVDGSWDSAPTSADLFPVLANDLDNPGLWISCPTSGFCGGVDVGADLVTSAGTGTQWNAGPRLTGGGLTAISCAPDSQFCAAVDGAGAVLTSMAGTWGAPIQLERSAPMNSVSCATSSFCVATAADGEAFTYDGSSWSPTQLGSASGVVSCSSPSFCLAVGESGETAIFDGQGWSPGPSLDATLIDGVSCVNASFCEAVGLLATAATFNGTSWTSNSGVELLPEMISCTSSVFCLAPGLLDSIGTFDGSSWTTLNQSFSPSVSSCVSSSWCMTVFPSDGPNDETGIQIATGSGSFIAGATPDDFRYISAVSCASETFCTFVDDQGYADSFYGLPATATTTTSTDTSSGTTSTQIATTTGGTTTTSPATTTAAGATTTAGGAITTSGATTTTPQRTTSTAAPADLSTTTNALVPSTSPVAPGKPASGSSSSTVTTPETIRTPSLGDVDATIRGWLEPLLRPTGKAGRLSTIKTTKGYTATFRAIVGGKLTVTWTTSERIRTVRRHQILLKSRTITVAAASVVTRAPSTMIKVKLTSAGEKLLRNLTDVKIEVTATFAYGSTTEIRTDTAKATATLKG